MRNGQGQSSVGFQNNPGDMPGTHEPYPAPAAKRQCAPQHRRVKAVVEDDTSKRNEARSGLGGTADVFASQCDTKPGAPPSGWISAAIMPFEPGPKRTSTYCPGRSSVMP